jgi:hypothetical protein
VEANPDRASREIRTARASRRPPRLSATLMALGIIFALAYVFFLREPSAPPTPDVSSIQGTYMLIRSLATPAPGATPRPASTLSGTFAALASGDAAGTQPPPGLTGGPPSLRSTYAAGSRTESTTQVLAGGTRTTLTLGAWPPVWRVATRSPLDFQGLAAVVRSAVEDKDRAVGIKPLKDGDRVVWRAAMELDGSAVQLVVDQGTGLVLWYSETTGSRNDTFSATPDWGATPSPDQMPGVGSAPNSAGPHDTFQTLHDPTYTYEPSLYAAVRPARYEPLEATLVPDGFTAKAVATTDAAGAPASWLSRHPGPPPEESPGERQVNVLYTRGLTWFTVQQLGPSVASMSAANLRAALASLATQKLSFQTTTLQYGAFAGRTAFTWYERSGPTLFVGDARHIVYVTGALTRQELITLAEGLKPLGGAPSASPSATP